MNKAIPSFKTRSLARLAHCLPAVAAILSALYLFPRNALAANTAGGITEWETPLQKVVASIDGPVAFGVSVIGIVIAGAMLIWGGEINEFSRKLIMLVLVLALIVTAVNLLSTLFGVGALVS
jgi:type IV secretory pathway VirB2 component (pilin)